MSTPTAATASTAVVNDATTPAATTAVVTNQNQSAFNGNNTPRPTVYNESGVQVVKGGQQLGIGFFDAVTTAYTNLVNNPMALSFIIFASFCLFTLDESLLSPVSISYNSLLTAANSTSNPFALRSVATLFAYLFSLLLEYEKYVAIIVFFIGIYIAKPNINNRYLCSIVALIAMLGQYDDLELFILCHAFLIYTQVRDTSYKFALGFLAVICVIFGFGHISTMFALSKMTLATAVTPPSLDDPPALPPTELPPVEEQFY